MKFLIVSIIVCIVIIGYVEANRPGLAPPPCSCVSPRCGPGGVPCKNCPDRSQLCQQLLSKLDNLKDQIGQCVCGLPSWALN
ncbi:salivary glue protein Sgs-7-like [Drosophila willistoni]|uniref:salivary glue protein Sgs-7-like n=1 Tax=Drosophila willistoni TaxID=7260 RepID=UPI001F071CFC|nr:salivary glue protein Sgs-7-like [Drosophila willistoni]